MRLTPVILIIVLFCSCGAPPAKKGWTDEERDVFLQSCITNSKEELKDIAAPYCDCMQKRIEVEYDDPDKVGELSMGKTMEWAKECLKDLKLPADSLKPAPNAGGTEEKTPGDSL